MIHIVKRATVQIRLIGFSGSLAAIYLKRPRARRFLGWGWVKVFTCIHMNQAA